MLYSHNKKKYLHINEFKNIKFFYKKQKKENAKHSVSHRTYFSHQKF